MWNWLKKLVGRNKKEASIEPEKQYKILGEVVLDKDGEARIETVCTNCSFDANYKNGVIIGEGDKQQPEEESSPQVKRFVETQRGVDRAQQAAMDRMKIEKIFKSERTPGAYANSHPGRRNTDYPRSFNPPPAPLNPRGRSGRREDDIPQTYNPSSYNGNLFNRISDDDPSPSPSASNWGFMSPSPSYNNSDSSNSYSCPTPSYDNSSDNSSNYSCDNNSPSNYE